MGPAYVRTGTLLLILMRASALTPAASVMDGVALLYNNDGENLWAVKSPYHPHTGWPIDTTTIRGSALDVANIADVDLICPFHVSAEYRQQWI